MLSGACSVGKNPLPIPPSRPRFALDKLCRVTVHGTVSDHQSLIDWSLIEQLTVTRMPDGLTTQ